MEESLELLRRQYFQLLPLEELTQPAEDIFKSASFQTGLVQKLFGAHLSTYTPPDRYKYRVLKAFISRLESIMRDPDEDVWFFAIVYVLFFKKKKAMLFALYLALDSDFPFLLQEIIDDLMSCFMTVVTSKLPSEAISVRQKCHVQYTLPFPLYSPEEPDAITLIESRALISAAGTTGLRTWDAALHLGSYLVSQDGRELVAGKTVLELGAGTGFLSILCTKYLEARYMGATDGDSRVIEDLSTNFLLNGLGTSSLIDARVLKWGGDSSELFSKVLGNPPLWQTVLAADVVS